MASLTTVLGMLPLITDLFFSGMSITIIGGLTFGTVLTLVVVPTLYSLFYGIRRTS
jgi:multidrug efflux pump subunit AcrB